jgi:putative copper export protein
VAKRVNKAKPQEFPESSNTKLLNVLLTVFASVLVGFITYLCTCNKMNQEDRKVCRTLLWIFFLIEAVLVVMYVIVICVVPGIIPVNEWF